MNNEQTKQIIEKTLNLMKVSFDSVDVTENSGRGVGYVIKTQDSGLLIGNKGGTLTALNYLVKRMVYKSLKSETTEEKFYIDVNNYQEKSFEELKQRVKIMSERAKSFGVNVPLPPMSSYERMLVHSFLEGESNIETESVGEGKERRVVIKYIKD
ncbi:MAG: R3H domain-containing nucleic acid-binding protein [bacterium]|nr:R3H domain-containing nucleic acid-binding protein [bacterium]